ncbi:hypothetical protein C8C76_1651 [Halanaerobium saccharolyticum]|jgi:hypothetical protein|uniref:Uncharacterized protein n=1 Tax=Halanaerobium saccharolyticum TaxID=43595 RepID=A0A2T5RF75_9FIRM|nr:hypothetical protein [Halanaerobium saccharolyticum]PTV92838.1 hypothetical protein C8C76_1651 [Halanaerobium saccharolyticum]
MGSLINLEEYRKNKYGKELEEFDEFFKEIPEEDFIDFLIEEDIDFDILNAYTTYNDEFIENNIEHLVHNTFPHCTICDDKLKKGDRVDLMWPQEYAFNLCNKCKVNLPEEFEKERIINLDKMKLIMSEENYKEIENNLNEDDIINIQGSRIIMEKSYSQMKYIVLDMDDGFDF